MEAYTTRDVAKLLRLSEAQVRCQARAGFLTPERGPRNSYRFSFQDLVLLRTARELAGASVPPRRIRVALCTLARHLPNGHSLSALRITADAHRVIVLDSETAWNAESGQIQIDFAACEQAGRTPSVAELIDRLSPGIGSPDCALHWFELGLELEENAPLCARDAYSHALRLDPHFADAHVNLGRLLQLQGEMPKAIEHYRCSLACGVTDPTAAFNLGTALESLERWAEAIDSYRDALAMDPGFADAHFNLARLYQQSGRISAASRHLREYQKLSGCVSS
jgi:tetratricopeptide (TPR) repeat protein